jgi:tRNA(adenine34) deaminase
MSFSVFSDEYYMGQALEQARRALAEDEIPVGAVLVVNRRIVGRAHNRTEALLDVTAHAELMLVSMSAQAVGGKYLAQATLYVTLEPCAMCAQALGWAQLGRLVYAADDPKRGYRRFAPSLLHPRTEVRGGLMADAAGELLRAFFQRLR